MLFYTACSWILLKFMSFFTRICVIWVKLCYNLPASDSVIITLNTFSYFLLFLYSATKYRITVSSFQLFVWVWHSVFLFIGICMWHSVCITVMCLHPYMFCHPVISMAWQLSGYFGISFGKIVPSLSPFTFDSNRICVRIFDKLYLFVTYTAFAEN